MRVLENARRPIGLHTVLSEGFRDVDLDRAKRAPAETLLPPFR